VKSGSAKRGEEGRRAIGVVLDVFGDSAKSFVFIGGGIVCLYGRDSGAPIRLSDDVDCISTLQPWVLQDQLLAQMCQRGKLTPDKKIQCRYHVVDSDVVLDVLSPEGYNVPSNQWLSRAAKKAAPYDLGDGRSVLAITPPYFLATKLVAFEDRGPSPLESRDAEDIVALAIEIPDLCERVSAEKLVAEIAGLWRAVFATYGISLEDLPEIVDSHLHRDDEAERDRAIAALTALARG
jgi:hypothetical protein